ncbi:MAG: aspartyl protease [Phycisphaerales bacterium]|nr:MAG: aspartyl protease [Phycisphaerales bacterium]
MGRIVVSLVVSNVDDRRRAQRGELPRDQVRATTVEASVDSGATYLCLPKPIVDDLGLPLNGARPTRTAAGVRHMNVYGGAHLEIDGRTCEVEVMSLDESQRALLGQIPLEILDFWIDPVNQRLVGNPEHGGQWMAEAY